MEINVFKLFFVFVFVFILDDIQTTDRQLTMAFHVSRQCW